MDSTTITNRMEHVALEGPIGLPGAIVVGVALLGVFAWSLWMERRILGRRTTALFLLLRAAASATVLWMLLAPTNVEVETTATRQTVAVLADVSASMQTVDPEGTAEDLRWALCQSEDAGASAVRSADGAVAALGVAQEHLQSAADALQRHQPDSVVVEATSAAEKAIQRAKDLLQGVADASQPSGAIDNPASRSAHAAASRLLQSMEGPEVEAFLQLCLALRKGRSPAQKGWRESFPDLLHRLAGMHRNALELARLAADENAGRPEHAALLQTMRGRSRVDRTARWLDRLHQSASALVGEHAELRMYVFDQAVRSLEGNAGPIAAIERETDQPATSTDLTAVLEELSRQRQTQKLAAAIVVSDFAHNHASAVNPRDAAAALDGAPVYTVPIGNVRRVRDVVLRSVTAPAVALRNDDVVVEVDVQAYDCQGEVCTVQLLEQGQVIDFREVPLDSDFASRVVRFERKMAAVGDWRFQVAIPPLKGELSEENNIGDVEVHVTRSDIKVLLADELPRWEYRYLAQLFRRDPKVECDELLFQPRLIATGRRRESQTFPTKVDDWDQYDVVLLGDLPAHHLPSAAQESLIEYLRHRGGTLVMIAGAQAMPHAYVGQPLETILPVRPAESGADAAESYAFLVTAEGRDHPALMIADGAEQTRAAWDFINRNSPLYELSAWRQPRPSARTLIAAASRGSGDGQAAEATSAFLCWQPVGRGRIVYLSAPDTYRLRFLRGDRLHYRFWGQLLRWAIASDLAAGNQFVRIRTDKSRYRAGESVQASVQLRGADGQPIVSDGLELLVTSGDQQRTAALTAVADDPGRYHAELNAPGPGVYRLQAKGEAVDALQQSEDEMETASFTVQADQPAELVDTRCNLGLAQQIADATGGMVLSPTAVDEVLQLMDLEPIVDERVATRPLWLEWKYLWIVFGCLQLEWVIRKWRGLS